MAKLIHYCWFGGNPLPDKLKKYIDSWKYYFPDFEIKRWDETNFNVHQCRYVSEAYESKKWAFVSDYARFVILEEYGGIYFDTDVEVVRSFDALLELNAFAGFETEKDIAPGLVLYAREPGNEIIRKTREWYESHQFLDENGERIRINVCGIFTGILKEYGFVPNGQKQVCGGMTLFPKEYFCPFNDATGLLHKTDNTYTIHWYDKSWMPKPLVLRNKCTRILHRYLGVDFKNRLTRIIHGNSI